MSETDWKQVGLKVEQSQYDGWKGYLEDSQYGSMSNLIRTAVEREIQRDTDVGQSEASETADSGVESEHVAELVDTVATMQNEMQQLQASVTEATDAMYTGGTSVSEDVTTAVYEALPEGPAEARSTHWIAEECDRDVTTVRVALEQLKRTTEVVSKVEYDEIVEDDDGRIVSGEKHDDPQWFKEA